MAHTCVSTASASLRLKSPPFSSNPSSAFDHQKTQLTFEPLRFRKLKQLSGNRKYVQHVSAKAVYSGEFGAASSRKGIWSIRDDLQIPASPYFPIYDGQGQGGAQMGKDGEFGAASSRKGIWSIRDDLLIPASPYFPIYDGQGQGGPQMGKDGPPQQHVQSIIGHLFRHRIIRCGGEVNDDMANLIVAQLLQLDAMDPKQDIVMYINSPGGSVTAGMAIYDTMRHVRPNVSTVCVGLAASMGAFLLSGGHKGKRYSLPSSRIMIHQPLGGAQGSTTDIEVQADEMMHHKANLSGHLAANTGQSLQKIYEDTDVDYFMSATEAKEYGLIDAIIWNPLKAFRPLAIAAEQQAAADNKSASPL